MKKTNRKGFTIVELVIVIAVIAVLAAVLIPTFSGIIEKAHLSNDTSLVASINTALAVEQVIEGEKDDPVEVARRIKKYGMELKTKSKGNYLWYDTEYNKVVLAGLNEDGIVLKDEDKTATTIEGKGKFNDGATDPSRFVEGYIFITEESKDGFANDFYSLRNPKVPDEDLAVATFSLRSPEGQNDPYQAAKDAMKTSMSEALGRIYNIDETRWGVLNSIMQRLNVWTDVGLVSLTEGAPHVIVSAEMKIVTENSMRELEELQANKSISVSIVYFHSGISFGDGVAEKLKDSDTLKKIAFVYNNAEIEAVDKANGGDIANLVPMPDIDKYIEKLDIHYVVKNDDNTLDELKTDTISFLKEELENNDILPYQFPYPSFYNQDGQAYDFLCYSLSDTGANPLGTDLKDGYKLTDADKDLITINNGNLTAYAFFKEADTDFKVGNAPYSSAGMTHALATGAFTNTGVTITVVSTDATLGTDKFTNLTIPAGVELLLPFQSDYKKAPLEAINADTTSGKTDPHEYDPTKHNKANLTGNTKLTVAENVLLKVEGSIYVDAQLYYFGTRYQGYIDDCAELVVNGTVQIGTRKEDGTVNKNGNIYAYGIVSGSGEIIAECGTVDEIFTVLDWGGGTSASNCIENNATPFHNWQVDNIRVPLTIKKDVTYGAYGSVYVRGNRSINFTLVGSSASNDTKTNPLFVLNKGAIQKTYDDGFNLALLDGAEVADAHKTVEIESITVDFKKVALPLPNFDIVVKNGAKLELNNNHYKVLPGSDVVVDEGGELIISTTVAFYDTYDLNLIQKYKNNDVLYTIAYIYKYKASNVAYTDKGLSLSYSALGSSGTAKCGVETYPYKASDANIGTALTVNGKLIFGEKAVFTGNIISGRNGATLEVKSGAKFNYTQDITDVSGNKKTVHGFTEGVAFSLELLGYNAGSFISCWQPSYAVGVDTTGMFVTAGDATPQPIPTTAATYTFDGSIWQ